MVIRAQRSCFRLFVVLTSLFWLSWSAGAQERRSSAGSELLLAGEETIVTAAKKSQKISEVPAAVTVITEEQIRKFGAITLMDILRYVPDVDVMENNATVANVSVRGFNNTFANKLLIMQDGRSLYEDFYGGLAWNQLPLLISSIKRIEIVRGPGSALYGANAFNGVINIITKTPQELASAPEKVSIRTVLGGQNSQDSELLAAGGNLKSCAFAIGAAFNHTDGWGERKPGNVRDSESIPVITLDGQKSLGRGTLRLALANSECLIDFDEAGLALADTHVHTSSATLSYSENGVKNPIAARIFGNFSLSTNQQTHELDSQTYDAEVQQARALSSRHNLVYGGSYRLVHAKNNTSGPEVHQQHLLSLYLQDDYALGQRTHLFAGFRFDRNSLYGTNVTPRFSLLHHLPDRQSVRLTYAMAFRNPTMLNTFVNYSYSMGGLIIHSAGNADIKPERVTSVEFAYRKELPKGYFGVTAYRNEFHDLIGTRVVSFFLSPPAPPDIPAETQYANLGGAGATGIALEGQSRIAKRMRCLWNYTYQDVALNNGQRVDLTPTHKLNIGIEAEFARRWEAFLGAHFVSSSVVHSGTGQIVPGYTRVDARLGYRFGRTVNPWTVSLVVQNVLDDRHLEYPASPIPNAPANVAAQPRSFYVMFTGRM